MPQGARDSATSFGDLPAPFSDTDQTPLNFPPPRDYRTRRPSRRPRWEPKRDRRDAAHRQIQSPRSEGWHSPALKTLPDGSAVRINFTYRNSFTTIAEFSLKARRTFYYEGPHELAYSRLLETDADTFEFQPQPGEIVWQTRTGVTRSYTPDFAVETSKGLRYVEIKATQAYFEDPELSDKLAAAEGYLSSKGIAFERFVGCNFTDTQHADIVKEVFDDRMQAFDKSHLEAVGELLDQDGGYTTLGRVCERLSTNPHHARALANALLVNRSIGFCLKQPLTGDTPVYRPAPKPRISLLRPSKKSWG